MTVNKITNAPTQNEIINKVNEIIDGKQDTLIAGTDLEIVNATTPRLPAGFTELEWLQSDGACCIDLGVVSYGNDEVEQKYQRPGTFESSVISWFGSMQNNAVPRFSIGVSGSSGVFAGFNFTKPLAEYDNNIHIITLKKVGSTYYAGFDDATASYAPTSASTNPSINSYLFARNGSTITYDGTGTRIFYHKQNRYDGTPLLDLVPAKRDSDNALGIYDLVSNTFLGNSGTGTFTGGPEVIYPTTTTINFTNASGYTTNEGTVTSVNNTQPDANGDVTLTIPTVNDGVLTITQNGTSKGTFSANQSTNNTIALTDTTYNAFTGADGTNAGSSGLVPAPSATDNDKYLKGDGTWASVSGGSSTDVQINGTSITSGGVANIVTNTAYNASSNKIATMSDLPTGGANTDLSNLTATGEAHFLKNRSTGVNSIAIGNGNSASGAINIGDLSTCGEYSIAIGGYNSGNCSIILGTGFRNNKNYSFDVGINDYNAYDGIGQVTYQMLDLKNGLIPDGRLSTNIQRTSTAVTHPASTAIGGVDVPVFVNSHGIVTSTGKSIASSRFDGQWVQVSSAVQLTTDYTPSSSVYSISLTGHLPSGSSNYDVLLFASLYTKTSSGNSIACYLGSDLLPITTSTYTKGILLSQARTRSNSNMASGASCILPVGSSKTVYLFAPSDWRNGTINLYMTAYRRIGTNS